MSKLIKVTIKTTDGNKTLLFREIPNVEKYECVCDSVCPYKGVCDFIHDPRIDSEEDSTFLDFCSSLGEEEESKKGDNDTRLINCVPVEGTIEKELSFMGDVVNNIIEKNPVVRVKDIIDNVCSDWCDSYTEDCSKCSSDVDGCFLKKIIKVPTRKVDGGEGED